MKLKHKRGRKANRKPNLFPIIKILFLVTLIGMMTWVATISNYFPEVHQQESDLVPAREWKLASQQNATDILHPQESDLVPVSEWKLALSKIPDTPYLSMPGSTSSLPLPVSKLMLRYAKYNYSAPRSRHTYDPPKECGFPPRYADFFRQSRSVRSSRFEDKTVYEMFYQDSQPQMKESKKNFTYIELGAFNGVKESNTRFFDVCLQWTGLLIEANPMKYPKLLETRPHAHILNYAPSCANPSSILFHSVSFANAAQANVPNEYEDDNTTLVQVPCDSLTQAVVDVLGGYVSFFSLDVEGAEAMILKTVDFSKVHVDLWMVENVNNFCRENCQSRDKARSILQGAGYEGYHSVVFGSDLFALPGSRHWNILNRLHPDKLLEPIQPLR